MNLTLNWHYYREDWRRRFECSDISLSGLPASILQPSPTQQRRGLSIQQIRGLSDAEIRRRAVYDAVGYDGKKIDVPFQGRTIQLVVDLNGIEFEMRDGRQVCLLNHNVDQVVGSHVPYVDRATSRVMLHDGRLINSPSVAQIVDGIRREQPQQMSIAGKQNEIRVVEEGETAHVNGHAFRGPIVVCEQFFCREISVTSLGANGGTMINFSIV